MKNLFLATFFSLSALAAFAQELVRNDLPLTGVSLFSSGVGFFEHSGSVKDGVSIPLVFDANAVNDVLKSLVIRDPASQAPTVTYASEETLYRTLKSLSIDLSGAGGVADVLAGLRGAEIRISTPKETVGRIVGVEKRAGSEKDSGKSFLTLSTADGIIVFDIAEMPGFTFTDKKISEDLKRALDLIAASRNATTRSLSVNLPGKGPRSVTLGYVAPVPVWKASYRLDLAAAKPVLQGWAIVDNTSDMDWNNVRLSLVTGKPVSFVQNLYPPYYFNRPVLPLAIAGAAQAAVYDSGFGLADEQAETFPASAPAPAMAKSAMMAERSDSAGFAGAPARPETLNSGTVETAKGSASGDFFQFVAAKPVTIARQQSAMLPLVDSTIEGQKVSVFSVGEKHPKLCVWLTNSSGMKLPAGPVTVFDGGNYAGDALVEFFPEGEKRILAFGEDLAVTALEKNATTASTASVTASKGVLTLTKKYAYTKTYQFRNADSKFRDIVIEHPVMDGAALVAPSAYTERTDSVYRFPLSLPANGEATLDVREEKPVRTTVALLNTDISTLVFYSTSSDMPASVRAALEKAVGLRKRVDDANVSVSTLVEKKNDLVQDQERIRSNLEAAGRDTQQGKDYLKKLVQADTAIEKASDDIAAAKKTLADASAQYKSYLAGLDLQ
jgi:hypothetical protein